MVSDGSKTTAGLVRLLLMLLFLIKAVPKLFGYPDAVADFERFRYPEWFRMFVGVTELTAAVMLLAHQTAGYALTILAAVMVGAAFTLINAGDFREALVPMVVLGMIGYVAWNSREVA
ncbi:MAG TPA: DoxX family protein [Terriglobales bacterium]|nr:DoxX family protein [Terriglobales bacterium]